MPTSTQTPLTEIIADGLDASVDGRGFDEHHQRAFELANAAPDLFAALERIGYLHGHRCSNLCATEPVCEWWEARKALAAARGEG